MTTTSRGQKSKCSKDKQGGGETRNAKAAMTINELFEYFQTSLKNLTVCGNTKCNCLNVFQSRMACSLAADYLVWFEHLSKFEQDCILAEWYKYASTG